MAFNEEPPIIPIHPKNNHKKTIYIIKINMKMSNNESTQNDDSNSSNKGNIGLLDGAGCGCA